MDYDRCTNRYMALGREIFQDACTGQTCLRTRQDRVERPSGQASTRGPCWRPAASDNGGRRLSGGGSAVERSAWSGVDCPRTLFRDGGQPRIAEETGRRAKGDETV